MRHYDFILTDHLALNGLESLSFEHNNYLQILISSKLTANKQYEIIYADRNRFFACAWRPWVEWLKQTTLVQKYLGSIPAIVLKQLSYIRWMS